METKTEYVTEDVPEQAQYRNPVKAVGHAQLYHAATLDPRISDGAYRLFSLYLMYAQQKDLCWPASATLADMFDCTSVTISRRNKELEDAGYITRQRRIGQTSITWIEDVEDIPFLQDLARKHLAARHNKNDTTNISKMIGQSYQKCYHEEEQLEEEQEKNPPTAGTPAPDWTSADVQHIEMVDAQDREHACANCDATFDVYTLLKTDAKCFECKRPVQVTDWNGDKTFRQPAQKYRPGHRQKRKAITVGDVVENCPPHLAPFSAAGQITRLKDALLKDRDTVLECLDWAHGMFRQGKMQPPFIVGNALTAAEKRIALLVVQLPEETPPIEPVWVEPEWMK